MALGVEVTQFVMSPRSMVPKVLTGKSQLGF